MAGKSLNELHELLDRLYHLKAKAVVSKTAERRKNLMKVMTAGVVDILASTGEHMPTAPSGGGERAIREQRAERLRIRRKAQELRHWMNSQLR